MEEEILVYKSEITPADFKEANKYLSKKYILKVMFAALVMIVIGIVLLEVHASKDWNSITKFVGYMFSGVGGVIFILMLMSLYASTKTTKLNDNISYEYKFYEDKVVIDSKSINSSGTSTIKYDEIESVRIQGKLLYIKIINNVYYMAKKEDNYEEFYNLLKSKVKNFKVVYK